MTNLERRASPRVQAVFRVRLAEGESFVSAHAVNVASGGVALRVECEVAVGKAVHLSASLPGISRDLELSGVVRWCDANTGSGGKRDATLGIELEFRDAGQRRDWLAVVRALTGAVQRRGPPTTETPYRVVVVEDNGVIAQMFDKIISELQAAGADTGYLRVTFETDPSIILETARSEDVDLVIVAPVGDLKATGAFIKRLRGELAFADVPLLATGFADEASGVGAVEAGATMYIPDERVMWRTLSSMCAVVVSGVGAEA